MFEGDFLNELPKLESFAERLQAIVGGELVEDRLKVSLEFDWHSPTEARHSKLNIRTMELELRHVRSDLVKTVQWINSQFESMRVSVVGKVVNPKSFLRKEQLEVREAYNRVKRDVDRLLLELAKAKEHIDTNPDG